MRYFIALLSITATLITGCVPAALITGATAGGAIVYDKRSMQTMSEDHDAEIYAQNWLNHDKQLYGHSSISITVFNNVALLTGQADTTELKDRANKIVSHVKYIKRTYNEINVGEPASTTQQAKDTWITTKVRSVLLAKSELNSNNIKVITENGTVYLMGNVSRKQADLASDAARQVNGVKQVVKIFEYE